ncbi:hypothetical protein PtrEW13061_012044, partial [Pyrenophora tritici-repentis]
MTAKTDSFCKRTTVRYQSLSPIKAPRPSPSLLHGHMHYSMRLQALEGLGKIT